MRVDAVGFGSGEPHARASTPIGITEYDSVGSSARIASPSSRLLITTRSYPR